MMEIELFSDSTFICVNNGILKPNVIISLNPAKEIQTKPDSGGM